MFSCLIPGLENVHLCTSSNDTLNSIISRLIIVKVLQIHYYLIVYVVDYFLFLKCLHLLFICIGAMCSIYVFSGSRRHRDEPGVRRGSVGRCFLLKCGHSSREVYPL